VAEGSKAFVKSLEGRIVETSGVRIYQAKAIPRWKDAGD
jgi:hypothetical protein